MATAYHLAESGASAAPAREHVAARFTAEDFLRMDALGAFDGRRVELADGIIVEEPLIGFLHGQLQALLMYYLCSAVDRSVRAVGSLSVRVSNWTIRDFDVGITKPDLGTVSAVAPADVILAVEISVSTLQVDLHTKSVEYAACGIPTYWVVDANAQQVHVMRGPGPAGYAVREIVRFADPLRVPGFGTVTIGDPDA